ncbi:MAG: virulence RhuM family protein [Kiritimatiellae bacterium]|nr:virulence RhuM family protein [Kiritimatiellia bacterium]
MDGSAWLSQAEMAELFDTSVPNINIHIRNIYDEGELGDLATVKKYLIVRQEGTRQVQREVDHYNIHMILAVGYRVRSPRGTQFRQWFCLEQAELRVKERKDLTLDYWRNNVDRLLDYNEKAILTHAGTVTREEMEQVARERYERFDEQRRLAEARLADAEDLAELEQLEKQLKEGEGRA